MKGNSLWDCWKRLPNQYRKYEIFKWSGRRIRLKRYASTPARQRKKIFQVYPHAFSVLVVGLMTGQWYSKDDTFKKCRKEGFTYNSSLISGSSSNQVLYEATNVDIKAPLSFAKGTEILLELNWSSIWLYTRLVDLTYIFIIFVMHLNIGKELFWRYLNCEYFLNSFNFKLHWINYFYVP